MIKVRLVVHHRWIFQVGGLKDGLPEQPTSSPITENLMRTTLAFLALLVVQATYSRQATSPESLLDHMTGSWILQGTIAGEQTTHDVAVKWVLQHQYLQLNEVSREKDSTGKAAYEAIVFIGWDSHLNQYGCYWLDNTGHGVFSEQGIGRAKPGGNEIRFLFTFADTSSFHTTFVYDDKNDSWKWLMDDDHAGKLQPFARVTLKRKK